MENGNNGKKKNLKWFINRYPQGIGLKMPFYYFIIC